MSQRLVLEVISGPHNGQVASVRDGESLVVGRLPECGLSFPQDLTVSRQHFRIEFESRNCRIVHLSQTGETLVNGNSVSTYELRTGDEIEFGSGNRIRISIDDGRKDIASPTVAPVKSGPPESEAGTRVVASTASCGWNLYESAEDRPGRDVLLKALIGTRQLSAIFDFRRIGISVPANLVDPGHLFTWIEPPLRDQFSPILFSNPANPEIADAINAVWGKDGLVCFGSTLQGDDLLTHWRKAIGMAADKPGDGMTAYFWPSILNMILTCQTAGKVATLLDGLTWLFVESPESPGQWRLFTKDDFSSELKKAGLATVPATKTSS